MIQVLGTMMLVFGILSIIGVHLNSQSGVQAVLASPESRRGAPGWRRALPGALLLVVAAVSVYAALSESRAAAAIVCSFSHELVIVEPILRLCFVCVFCNRLL